MEEVLAIIKDLVGIAGDDLKNLISTILGDKLTNLEFELKELQYIHVTEKKKRYQICI